VPVLHSTPALSDDDVVPVWGLSLQWSQNGGDETSLSVSVVMEYFSEHEKGLRLLPDHLALLPYTSPENILWEENT